MRISLDAVSPFRETLFIPARRGVPDKGGAVNKPRSPEFVFLTWQTRHIEGPLAGLTTTARVSMSARSAAAIIAGGDFFGKSAGTGARVHHFGHAVQQ